MMSRFLTGNLFLLLSMVGASGGHILLKSVVDDVKSTGISWQTLQALGVAGRLWRAGGGAALVVLAFLFWLLALTRLDLSYAYPVACSSLLLVALFSAIFLGEPVTARTWIATVLILAGILLLAPKS
jgi:drug/metabolite transporter (DMT)-like permease